MNNNTDLSIVIPAYNEEFRLPTFLNEVIPYIDSIQQKIEVIIINDGSTDNTHKIINQFMATDKRISVITSVKNCGKGASVKKGILKAKGTFVLFIDADGATPIDELEKVLPLIDKGKKFIIGSRRMQNFTVQRNVLRRFLAFILNVIINHIIPLDITDTQCGFKVLQKDIAIKLFSKMKEDGWAFDIELLYLAKLSGCTITEIPVNWNEIKGGSLHPFKDGLKMLIAILRIKNETKN